MDWILHRDPWFPTKDGGPTWLQSSGNRWVNLGEQQAEQIGRRYGVLGFEKESKEERAARRSGVTDDSVARSGGLSGDVANMVAAYIAVKVSI